MFKIISCIAVVSALVALVSCDRKQDVLFAEYGAFETKTDFYSEDYLNGRSTSLETRGSCKNLPKSWHKRALSVDTKGTCAKVCDDIDCKGTCVYVYPAHGEQQLSTIKMAKKVVSVMGCFQDRNTS